MVDGNMTKINLNDTAGEVVDSRQIRKISILHHLLITNSRARGRVFRTSLLTDAVAPADVVDDTLDGVYASEKAQEVTVQARENTTAYNKYSPCKAGAITNV